MDFRIVSIPPESVEEFNPDIPGLVAESLKQPGHYALAALGSDDEGDFLLGTLAFYLGDSAEDEYYVSMIYIYVDEEYRENGVGTSLINEVHRVMSEEEVAESCVLIPEEVTGVKSFFRHRGYSFDNEYSGDGSEVKMEKGIYLL